VTQAFVLTFDYNHSRKEEANRDRRRLIALLLVIFLIISLTACFVCRSRLKMVQARLRKHFEQQQEKKEQHSINMEKTFIPG
jgi:hypothetical protein